MYIHPFHYTSENESIKSCFVPCHLSPFSTSRFAFSTKLNQQKFEASGGGSSHPSICVLHAPSHPARHFKPQAQKFH
jgi:hypothetical protein